MTVFAVAREQVRQRADFTCEFCGVSETDVGGQLTVDHFQPIAKEGSADLDNLIYCCIHCNQYKADYWPQLSDDPLLWNPRSESALKHFFQLEDGRLHPRSEEHTSELQ